MEITFLGTASHTPTDKRNHTGILVNVLNESILIDCGEGIQRQFKIAKKNPCKLTKLLITHWHGDHTLGVPGLLQTLAMAEYSKELEIYGPRGTKEKFALLEKLYGTFKIKHTIHEVRDSIVADGKEVLVESAAMKHGIPAVAYSIIVKEKRRIHKDKLEKYKLGNTPKLKDLQAGKDIVVDGKKFTAKEMTYMQEGKKVAVVMDTAVNDNAVALATNADLLICESTYHPDEQVLADERKHLTAKDAATIAKKAKAKKLAITHLSHRYAARPKALLEVAKKTFKNVILPKDLDELTI